MMDMDFTKEYRLPVCDSLREMRIQSHPMDYGNNIFVDDRLESDNYIKIYEYLGGTFYIPTSADELKHSSKVVPVAGIKVSIKEEEQVVQVDKIFCEFGYEDFIAKLMQQAIMDFATFYCLRVGILDLRKNINIKKIRQCKFVDVLSW